MSRGDGMAPPWQREHQYAYRRRSLVSGSCAGLKAIVMACPLIYPQLTMSIPDIVAKASRFFQLPLRMTACPLRRLDRIVVRWNRAAVPSDNVNPIYFKRVEQLRVGGSPREIGRASCGEGVCQ